MTSTVGLIALGILAGVLLAILIGAVCFLIWSCWKIYREVQARIDQLQSMTNDQRLTIQQYQSDTTNLLRSVHAEFAQSISRINGEGLEIASKQAVAAAGRIEKAAVAFGELAGFMLADRDTISSNGAGLKPDE